LLRSKELNEKKSFIGPNVWGPSGYEDKSFAYEQTKHNTSTTQRASYHYVLPELNASTKSNNTFMDLEKQKAAQELFCGFDSIPKPVETNTLTNLKVTSKNDPYRNKNSTISATLLTNVSQDKTNTNDWLNDQVVDTIKSPASTPYEKNTQSLILDSDTLLHESSVPKETRSTVSLDKTFQSLHTNKWLSLLSPMTISIDQVIFSFLTEKQHFFFLG
jgi:hypothetical protein